MKIEREEQRSINKTEIKRVIVLEKRGSGRREIVLKEREI